MNTLQKRRSVKFDTVCSMKVESDKTDHFFKYNGEEYYVGAENQILAKINQKDIKENE